MRYTLWLISDQGNGMVRVRCWLNEFLYDIKEEDKDFTLHVEALMEHMKYLDETYPTAKFEID